jgi:hypothetical protein
MTNRKKVNEYAVPQQLLDPLAFIAIGIIQ